MPLSRIAAIALLLLGGGGLLNACTVSGRPLEGQVLEAGTNKPVAGAIVVVGWHGNTLGSTLVCVHTEIVTADANGRYQIPFWWEFSEQPSFGTSWEMNSYKPGYVRNDEYNRGPHFITAPNVDLLEPSRGERAERLKYLLQLAQRATCGWRENNASKLAPLYRALYEEGKQIGAVTEREQQLLASLQYYLQRSHAEGDTK